DDHRSARGRRALAVLRVDARLRREAAGVEAPSPAARRAAAHLPDPASCHRKGAGRVRRLPLVAGDRTRAAVRGHAGAVRRRVRARLRGNRRHRRGRPHAGPRLIPAPRRRTTPPSRVRQWPGSRPSPPRSAPATSPPTRTTSRARSAIVFPRTAADVTVVFHRSAPLLDLAHPLVLVERRLTAPAARRYVVGSTVGAQTIHVLAPRALRARASAVPGSREMLERAPDVLYARLVVGLNNRRLPPRATPARLLARLRWAWLVEGT